MIKIQFCGFHTRNVNRDIIYRPKGTGGYLFLVILSPMHFEYQNGESEVAQPGACILYTPRVYQHYQAEDVFFNSFVEFTCDERIQDVFAFPCNQIFYPAQYEVLNQQIKKIHQEYLGAAAFGEEMLALYLQELLILLSRSVQAGDSAKRVSSEVYQEFYSARFLMLNKCQEDWTTDKLCELVNFEKSRFYQLYQQFFNSTPNEDLIQARLQLALYHMTNQSIPIQTAAYQAGFQNVNYFNRLFKKRFGCAPGEYRKKKDYGNKEENGWQGH